MSDKFVLRENQQNQPQNNQLQFVSREHMLFATPLWQTQIKGVDNQSIKDYCYFLRENTKGVVISNRGGWHSGEILQPIPIALKNLFEQTTAYTNEYCAQITGINDLVLGNFWININGKYTYNRRHDHQNSILSGVYYVDAEGDNIGNLIIERDDNMEFFANTKYKGKTPLTQINFLIKPLTGFLIMFPSWIHHSVEMNMENRDRISIAFNLVDPGLNLQKYG